MNPIEQVAVTQDFILTVAGSLIFILLSIIGYFISNNVKLTKELSSAVSELKTLIEVIKTNQSNSSTNCEMHRGVINTRLNAHSDRLNEHDKIIERLKGKVDL